MKKSRYKEEQITGVLKEVDAGAKLQDVYRGPLFLSTGWEFDRPVTARGAAPSVTRT